VWVWDLGESRRRVGMPCVVTREKHTWGSRHVVSAAPATATAVTRRGDRWGSGMSGCEVDAVLVVDGCVEVAVCRCGRS
jgi:hypothetical protein